MNPIRPSSGNTSPRCSVAACGQADEAILRFTPQPLAVGGGQSLRVETVAVVQAKQALQRGLQWSQGRIVPGAEKPIGKSFAGLPGQAAAGQFVFELIELGIKARPGGQGAGSFLTAALALPAGAKNKLQGEQQQDRHPAQEDILAHLGMYPA